MNVNWFKKSLQFLALGLLQVLVFNTFWEGRFFDPQIYILFLLLFPITFPRIPFLLLGFFVGLTMDFFTYTIGIHAAACTFLCFIRPSVLRFINPGEQYDSLSSPSPSKYGFAWFIKYLFISTFGYTFVLFFIEKFSFSSFLPTLFKVVLSTLVSVLIMFGMSMINYKSSRN